MNPLNRILLKSLVKEFYRENAGVFVFFFVVMFGVVGILHNATFWSYHNSLILGMLKNPGIFGFILIAWFLYARKSTSFVMEKMSSPEYGFLQILTRMNNRRILKSFLMVEICLYLPILLYSLIIVGVAIYHLWIISALIILLFHTVIVYGSSKLLLNLLNNPESEIIILPKISFPVSLKKWHITILLRYLFHELKMLVVGIKTFTCCILYLLALNNTEDYYDLQFPFLFFSFGLFANGIIVHRLRQFEETQLSFYRGLPINITSRFLQYAMLYLVFFIPELITIAILCPMHLHYNDAINFALCGYGILLLLNSVSFIAFFEMKIYLRVLLLLYAILYVFVAVLTFNLLYMFLLSSCVILFFVCYYKYEHSK